MKTRTALLILISTLGLQPSLFSQRPTPLNDITFTSNLISPDKLPTPVVTPPELPNRPATTKTVTLIEAPETPLPVKTKELKNTDLNPPPKPPADYYTAAWTESPACLNAADIQILVGNGASFVQAKLEYLFLYFLDRDQAPTLYIHIPVYAPNYEEDLGDIAFATDIQFEIAGKKLKPIWQEPRDPLEKFNPVPSDARLVTLTYAIPRSLLLERFQVKVSYMQHHFQYDKKEMTALFPQLPYFEKYKQKLALDRRRYRATFQVPNTGDITLTRVTPNKQIIEDTPKKITIQLTDNEPIALEVHR